LENFGQQLLRVFHGFEISFKYECCKFITESNTVIDLARALEGHWLVAYLQGYATTDVDIGVFDVRLGPSTNGVWGCPTTLFVSGSVVPTIVSSKKNKVLPLPLRKVNGTACRLPDARRLMQSEPPARG
jgi:hypothetical protein